MYRCAGLVARSEALADEHSEELVTRVNTTVASEVWVMRSTAVAARDIGAFGSRRAQACFARDNGGGAARGSVRPLRAPVGAGPAVRIEVRDRFRGRPIRIVVDQFVFQTGPAEVQLLVADVDRAPPAAFERSVLAVLIHRAGQSLP